MTKNKTIKFMQINSPETNLEMKQLPITIGKRGEIMIPQSMQESLNVTEGDRLELIQVGQLIFLSPKSPQVPQLIDKIVGMMDNENVRLTDLLAGIDEERENIFQEQQWDASKKPGFSVTINLALFPERQ